MKNLFRVWLFTAFIFLFVSASAWAASITSASINYASNQITITGAGFALKPVVYFNGAAAANKLAIVGTPAKTSITAQLPTGLTSGTYELTVQLVKFYVAYAPDTRTSRAALMQWGNKTFTVGSYPRCVAFDGANIWVVNYGGGNVTKLSASNGSLVGTYNVGSEPYGVAFDGSNIWVTNYSGNTVTKLRASDGSLMGTYTVGNGPYGIAFDGTNMWGGEL